MVLLILLVLFATPTRPTVVEELKRARDCHTPPKPGGQNINCAFKISGLWFSVDSVGDPNVGLAVYEVDPNLWIQVSINPGVDRCVIVLRAGNMASSENWAQINLDSARVYPDAKTCVANRP